MAFIRSGTAADQSEILKLRLNATQRRTFNQLLIEAAVVAERRITGGEESGETSEKEDKSDRESSDSEGVEKA